MSNFEKHWEHQQGAVFLKKDEIYALRKNLAEYFYRMGFQDSAQRIAELEAELKELKIEAAKCKGKER